MTVLRPFSVKVLLRTVTPDFFSFKKKGFFENTQASVSVNLVRAVHTDEDK